MGILSSSYICEKRLLASSCLCVGLSVRPHATTRLPNDRIFLKSHIELLFESLLTKINFNLNMIRISGTLHEDVCTIVIMSCSVLLVINVSDRVYSENRNTHFIFSTFKENCPFMRYCLNVWHCQTCHGWLCYLWPGNTKKSEIYMPICFKYRSKRVPIFSVDIFKSIIKITKRDIHFLLSVDSPGTNASDIKVSVFLYNYFFICMLNSLNVVLPLLAFPILLLFNSVSVKVYG